jgi:AGZA family xanthine/uracil permease-like MFS transporter
MVKLQQSISANPLLKFSKGEWNGFLTLLTDNLAKIVLLPIILIGTFHFAPSLVFGRILPGIGLSLFVGLGLFTYLGNKLAKTEHRSDVTALLYGISTPAMFVYLFAIIGPVYFAGKDPLPAYQIGLGAAFLSGLIKMSGSLIGPWLERVIPRAGLLGTIAGVAIVWIAMVPIAIIFTRPMIGLPVLFIVLLGFLGRYQFPFRLPTGLVALGVGVLLGFITGDTTISFKNMGFYPPIPVVGDVWTGLHLIRSTPELLVVLIPIEIYNFIESIGNVKSAQTAGDNYNIRTSVWVDGLGTCIGSLFGSPFPTTIYLGHPAYKQMGARTNYAFATGLFLWIASLVGLFAFLQHLIPAAAVAPLLVFVGIVMCQYAFQSTPAYGAAIAIALVPHIADLLKKQLDGTLLEVLQRGAVSPDLALRLAQNQGVYFQSYALLSHGAIITGLLWGSIVVFIMDGDLRKAALFSFLAFCLSLVGLIHAPQIGLSLSPIALGYLCLTVLFVLFHLLQPGRQMLEIKEEAPSAVVTEEKPVF